jgi:3-oxoacyl-[acyl-carrier protein] reductase
MSSSSLPLARLARRVALVTGVSRPNGIGFAVARRLGQVGAKLFVHYGPPADQHIVAEPASFGAVDVMERLRSNGIEVAFIKHDFTDPQGPEAVVAAAVGAYGHVNILDANHAYCRRDRLEVLSAEELDRHLLINVPGSLMLTKAFAA